MKRDSTEKLYCKQTALKVPIVLPRMNTFASDDEYHNAVARLIWANLNTRRKGNCNKLAIKQGFASPEFRGRQWAGHALLVTQIYSDSKQYASLQAWLASLPTVFERITQRLRI